MVNQKKILITGGSGLVGNELMRQLLSQGYHVRAIYHRTPILIQHPHLEKMKCDLLDVVELESALNGITHVYHCAGLVKFTSRNRKQLYTINVEATANVVNAALNARVEKMVHVSSVAALGRMRQGTLIHEKMNWTKETGGSVYGHTKYLGELEVWRGIAEGLNAVIVNPSIVLGYGNWENGSTAIFNKVYHQLNWYTEGVTGFVDVSDVCKAMMLLMEENITSERFIINAENLSFKEVIFSIADAFGVKRPHLKATRFLSAIAWRLEAIKSYITRKEPLITKETAQSAMANVYFDNSKFIRQFPAFQYQDVRETIRITCEKLRKENQ